MTLIDIFKVKHTNMHAIYTPESKIFIRFAPQRAVFELRANFRKSEYPFGMISENVPAVVDILSFNIFFAPWEPASKIRDDFQNCRIWA